MRSSFSPAAFVVEVPRIFGIGLATIEVSSLSTVLPSPPSGVGSVSVIASRMRFIMNHADLYGDPERSVDLVRRDAFLARRHQPESENMDGNAERSKTDPDANGELARTCRASTSRRRRILRRAASRFPSPRSTGRRGHLASELLPSRRARHLHRRRRDQIAAREFAWPISLRYKIGELLVSVKYIIAVGMVGFTRGVRGDELADRLDFEIDVELETGPDEWATPGPGLIEAFRQTGRRR